MSGADLEYQRMLAEAGVSNSKYMDGARLEQIADERAPQTVDNFTVQELAEKLIDPDDPASTPIYELFSRGTLSRFGINGVPTDRIPITINSAIVGADHVGSENLVGAFFNTDFSGDFSTDGGVDPGFVFGADAFYTVHDSTGLNTVNGWVGEVAIGGNNDDIPVVIGMESGANFAGADADGHIGQLISFHGAAPRRILGAVGGTVDTAYTMKLDEPTIGGANFTLYAQGTSRFTGRVDIGAIAGLDVPYLEIRGNIGSGSSIKLGNGAGTDKYIVNKISGTANTDRFIITDVDDTELMFVAATGRVGLKNQLTRTVAQVAGGAAALPANPLCYLVIEVNDTTVSIPCYTFA